VYGFANRSASNVVLETDEPRHPPLGFIPLDFRGAWHGSRLALHVTFTLYNGQGYLSGSIPDEVRGVHFTLHKSGLSTYQRACARIRARV
jgi:hypothetical protein